MVQSLKHRLKLVVLILFCIYFLCACSFGQQIISPKNSPSPTSPNDRIDIYFTDPGGDNAKSLRGGPDSIVAASIDQARLSVDAALYDLNLWSIRDALIHAHNRGVLVRIVTESDNIDGPEIQALKDAGIDILGDRREGLMHNKFIIIDRYEVWTGSMNYTLSDSYNNYNNLVKVKSVNFAENFTTEFEEMFQDDLFGPNTRSTTPHPTFQINGLMVEVYFSPDDHVAQQIIRLIQGAKQNISFLAFSFTSDEIADALLERASVGVTVRGVFDQSQVESNIGGEYQRILSKGVDVRILGGKSLLHDKVIIIDNQIVITGSYNFSKNAEINNDENVLIIHNSQLSQQYTDRFLLIYQGLSTEGLNSP
jgi:phosphatidylserine/phosphatidylglycerophosphate/cardiolipin synthase-like enzyme